MWKGGREGRRREAGGWARDWDGSGPHPAHLLYSSPETCRGWMAEAGPPHTCHGAGAGVHGARPTQRVVDPGIARAMGR